MDSTKSRIKENLVWLRRWHGLSQDQVAEELGVSRIMYAYYETGRHTPSAERLNDIAALYGIPVSAIIHQDMSKHRFSPYELNSGDDIQQQLTKFMALPFLHRLLVIEKIRTLIEIESSLYEINK